MIYKLRIRLHIWHAFTGMSLWQALRYQLPTPAQAASAELVKLWRKY